MKTLIEIGKTYTGQTVNKSALRDEHIFIRFMVLDHDEGFVHIELMAEDAGGKTSSPKSFWINPKLYLILFFES